MPYRSGAINSAVIKDTVTEESHDSAILEEPSPSSSVPITAVITNSEIDRQATRYSDNQDAVNRAGYFPSVVDIETSDEIVTQVESSSRRISNARRPSQNLWTRSRSFAGSYLKPPALVEQNRRGVFSEVQLSSNVAPPFGTIGQEDAGRAAGDNSRGDSRRGSVNKAASSTSASQAGSRAGSFSNPLRKGFSHQEGLHRRSESINKISTEEGRRRSTATPPENASLATGSTRPSLERTHSAPSNYQFKTPEASAPASEPRGAAAYGKLTQHTSKVDEPLPETINKVDSLLRVHEKSIPQAGLYFRSRRIKDRNTDRSWLRPRKDHRQKWLTIIPLIGIILGFCIAGAYIFVGIQNVPVHKYCMVYEDTFSSGDLDLNVWTKEVQVGGYGNGQFEETTATDENIFIKDNILQIKPTLQDIALLTGNHTLNLTKLGTCTSDEWSNCVATTNTTNGTIINPVKSGRINTKKGANIKYGRIEVEAKMPQGDWIWPAIWMLPKDSVYGTWPRSGEIDIAESRGNNWTYPTGGNDIMSSSLHWGVDSTNDGWWRTYRKQNALHSTFSDRFHTYGLEWSEKYLYTYLNGRLLQVLYTKFRTPFWQRGDFPLMYANGTAIVNPWGKTGNAATPFDQDFYLVLNVAVGGTNGWFEDGKASKPWVDTSPTAKGEFWAARDQWYPTWQTENGPALQVKSIRMWQQQGYNNCGSDAKSI
ncbi:hypothetical protein A1O3_07281 [Capronia epimyces CBS 606.96]|uniref:GH16 domain-containing protein n=1 Tax=Capronia epimyces CBS 606.96 TaxID=1182542 RepID=W9XLC3_9EURO|nr:uncharacterized protein A1O3_07281 [Capronia epimyces CBS 606.96]EXJ80993.1 hypothetical protein A1O3_07281 [Capronia epimyces CBS 606.96]